MHMKNESWPIPSNLLLIFLKHPLNIARYEYVKSFEQSDLLLPNTWIVVRIDGRGFHKSVLSFSPPSSLHSTGVNTRHEIDRIPDSQTNTPSRNPMIAEH
jgi:hypothetical protein